MFVAVACLVAIAAVAARSPVHIVDSTARYLDSSDGGDWPGYGRTFGEQHYSPATQIDQTNIGRLGLIWSMDLAVTENSVTQPIAVDGVLYFATGHSIVRAVDVLSGHLLWRYDPKAAEKAGLNLRIGWGSRGIAWWNKKIYTGTTDGRLIAIDCKTGKPIWSVQTFNKDTAGYISGAPRVFNGRVIIGFGGDVGNTVPGDPAAGFENEAMSMAAQTWSGDWWRFGGGGTVWNAMAYDPETDTIYLGIGEGYPHNRRIRSEDRGDNLFTSSIVALDGKSGNYKWHYQVNPGDTWDYDAVMDIELANIIVNGTPRKVLMQAPKNGFYYVIDRVTGKLISAQPFAKVTWASRIDLNTGRPIEKPGAHYPNGTTAEIWPSEMGAHQWMPMAYSPKTQLTYIPVNELGEKFSDNGIDLKNWVPQTDRSQSGDINGDIGAGLGTGVLLAWNPASQKAVWKVRHPTTINGGVMATAGDIVFQGTIDGTFKAYAAASGKPLWSFAAQAPIVAAPISYEVQGIQYVTVLTGMGTGAGIFASMTAGAEKYGIDPRSQSRRVLTFALDGKATLPPATPPPRESVEDPQFKPDPLRAAAGEAIYNAHCAVCHGVSTIAATHAPDLRRSAIPLSADAFANIVRGGAFVANGMPVFGELTDEQLANLRQYVRTEAQKIRPAPLRADLH
jgi:quinohemoprotein ethanol dehydrogenase